MTVSQNVDSPFFPIRQSIKQKRRRTKKKKKKKRPNLTKNDIGWQWQQKSLRLYILQVSPSFMAPMKNGDQAHLKPHTSLAVKSGKFGNAIIHGRGKKKSRAKEKRRKKGEKKCMNASIHSNTFDSRERNPVSQNYHHQEKIGRSCRRINNKRISIKGTGRCNSFSIRSGG